VRKFEKVTALCQHQSHHPICRQCGEALGLFIGSIPKEVVKTLYHGTTLRRALLIEKNGFHISTGGFLGPGIYCADRDKAIGYARLRLDKDRDTGRGAVLELTVTARNVKYTTAEDREWQRQGYDACQTDRTTMSYQMEWCVKSPSQITGVRVGWLVATLPCCNWR
jgi:hypothetical protein